MLRDFAADLPPAGAPLTADALWNFIVKQLPDQLQRYADDFQGELLRKGGLILLDGLDEVPDARQRREQVKQAVKELAGIYRNCRFLVTSRTYAYQRQDWKLNGFAEREVQPFTRGQIDRFVDTWYAHMVQLFRLTEADAEARAEILKRATRRTELRELAERPLLLTLMARLQTKGGGSLPENREELSAQSVDMLLDEWEGLKLRRDANDQPIVAEPSLSEWLNASRENIRRELDKLAYDAHLIQPSLVGTADIRQGDVIAVLMAASKDQPDTKFVRLEEYLRDRAGLLTSHGEGLSVPAPLVSGVSGGLPSGTFRLPRHTKPAGQDRSQPLARGDAAGRGTLERRAECDLGTGRGAMRQGRRAGRGRARTEQRGAMGRAAGRTGVARNRAGSTGPQPTGAARTKAQPGPRLAGAATTQ
ncbi:MAG: NACHT domain-containing protein, partial [Lysobacter sp.]